MFKRHQKTLDLGCIEKKPCCIGNTLYNLSIKTSHTEDKWCISSVCSSSLAISAKPGARVPLSLNLFLFFTLSLTGIFIQVFSSVIRLRPCGRKRHLKQLWWLVRGNKFIMWRLQPVTFVGGNKRPAQRAREERCDWTVGLMWAGP